jgi:WS/DGAT/MGAT family acyltransferase
MVDRLSALDASFLYLEQPGTPMHVGGVMVLQPARRGVDLDGVQRMVENRLARVPRYRQKIKTVPGFLGLPVWIDDTKFDISYHVRLSALPSPGTDEQLWELVARLMSRPLDRSRPLWEFYLVEGLRRQRIAMVYKTHQALADTRTALDIGQVVLDETPAARDDVAALWMPRAEPGPIALMAGAVRDTAARPRQVADTMRANRGDLARTVGRVWEGLVGMVSAARSMVGPAPHGPLNVPISSQRRFAVARATLADVTAVRTAHGGTVNDVVLTVVAGALRNWLMSRGEAVRPSTTVRAMSPVRGDGERSRVAAHLVDLPVGEPSPVVRLHHVRHAMQVHEESGESVAADVLVRLSGFAPPTLQALAARAASGYSSRIFNLTVTNASGPQRRLYAAGARLTETFPVVPIPRNQVVAVGVTSYNGGVFFGLNADRDTMPDADDLGGLIEEALAELVEASSG